MYRLLIYRMLHSVFMIAPRGRSWDVHSGRARVTFPLRAVGQNFLKEYGDRAHNPKPFHIPRTSRRINVRPGRNIPEAGLLEYLNRTPFEDPKVLEERNDRLRKLSAEISVETLQFGYPCRDGVFSIEHEATLGGRGGRLEHDRQEPDGWLTFDGTRGTIRIGTRERSIVIHSFTVLATRADLESHSVLLVLQFPPSMEENSRTPNHLHQTRFPISAFDNGHKPLAGFTSRSVRALVFLFFFSRGWCSN